jgi:LysM repeat protein
MPLQRDGVWRAALTTLAALGAAATVLGVMYVLGALPADVSVWRPGQRSSQAAPAAPGTTASPSALPAALVTPPAEPATVPPVATATAEPSPTVPPTPAPAPASSVPAPTATPSAQPVTPALLVHVVSQGDTLFAIARRYGVTVDDLRRANNLGSSDVIVPGQRLVVPRA